MKLHLPKLLLVAVCAAECVASAATVSRYDSYYTDSELTVNSNITYNGDDDDGGFTWNSSDGGVMRGSGKLSGSDDWGWELSVQGTGKFTVESGVRMENADIYAESDLELILKNTIHNGLFEESGGCIDLTHATLTGSTVYYANPSGGTYKRASFDISSSGSQILITDTSWADGELGAPTYTIFDGNVVLNGNGSPYGASERQWSFNVSDSSYQLPGWGSNATVTFESQADSGHSGDPGNTGEMTTDYPSYGTLSITGSLTIKSATAVIFSTWNDYYDESIGEIIKSEYVIPSDGQALIICGSVKEESLTLLKPYVMKEDSIETDYYYRGSIYTKSLDDYAFYAVTGGDGRVYIYLGKGGTGSGSPIPEGAIQIGEGETVVLGSTEETTPGADAPVYIQGGTADATGLGNDLLNNQIIMGTSGTLVTTDSQSMKLSGNSTVKYSIVGVQAAGASLSIGTAGSNTNLTLSGSKYDTAEVTVQGGTLTISKSAKLGLGTDSTEVQLNNGTSLTNYGTVAGDIAAAEGSTLLNQGTIAGDIDLAEQVVLTNNGTISGTLNAKGNVYGSGIFADTVLASGASLHVGNSPGYQKHTSLTIDRGATLSFSVDGPVAATAASHGSGTHSVLETGTLTINPGTGTVTVNVDVTMGIVAAGSEQLSLTLLDAGTTNAKAGDFTLKLSDESKLLEEGASLSFDATEGTLVLNGAVSKAALAALMDSNAANVANTMWASANAVQELARTAEKQFLVGMLGQTTFWGAGVGSFMDISGDKGFTSNAGGYAVGVQHAFTESFRAGFAFGQMFGDFKSDDDQLKVDQMALIPALTAQYVTKSGKMSTLTVSGHLAYGIVENEADTYQAGTTGKADWDDEVLNIGVNVAWNIQPYENVSASFFTGLNYQLVEQDDFTEEFTGGERDYRSGSMSSLSIPLGVTLRGIYQMEGTNVFAPELTLAYIGDVARDNPEVKTSVYGFNREGKGTNIGRSAFMLNAGANWMFDSTWSLGAFYTLEARSNQVNQSVNAALRCCF